MAIVSPDTSPSLLHQLGDPAHPRAWHRLVDLYAPIMVSWLRSSGLQQVDLEDLIQQSLTVVALKVAAFEHNGRAGAFRTWLKQILINQLSNFRRSQQPNHSSLLSTLADPASELSRWWDHEHDRRLLSRLLAEVRLEFGETTWLAFYRTAIEGASGAEAAAELALSVNAVQIAKSRVLKRLRHLAEGMID